MFEQPTTLAGVMRRFGTSKLPIPQPNTRAGRQFIAANGNLKGKKVQSLISQLTSPNPGAREQYRVITQKHGDLGAGVWRRYRIKDAVSLALTALVVVAVIIEVRNFLVSLGCNRGIFLVNRMGASA